MPDGEIRVKIIMALYLAAEDEKKSRRGYSKLGAASVLGTSATNNTEIGLGLHDRDKLLLQCKYLYFFYRVRRR